MSPSFLLALFFAGYAARCFNVIDASRQGKVVQIAFSHLISANHKHKANVKESFQLLNEIIQDLSLLITTQLIYQQDNTIEFGNIF